jgi:hypothetical protein
VQLRAQGSVDCAHIVCDQGEWIAEGGVGCGHEKLGLGSNR